MFAAAGQGKGVKLRDGHVLLSLIMQPNLWLGLHSALWVIRDHVVCLAEKLHSALIPSYPPFTRHLPSSSLSSSSPSLTPPPPKKTKKTYMLPNEQASCQENAQINKHGSHISGSQSSESLYLAVRYLEMCLCAQNSIRGSRQWSTLWFALWNLLDE